MDVHVSYMLGDDCVAITGGRGGSSDINITGVACGPGHGIRFVEYKSTKNFEIINIFVYVHESIFIFTPQVTVSN